MTLVQLYTADVLGATAQVLAVTTNSYDCGAYGVSTYNSSCASTSQGGGVQQTSSAAGQEVQANTGASNTAVVTQQSSGRADIPATAADMAAQGGLGVLIAGIAVVIVGAAVWMLLLGRRRRGSGA